MKTKTKTLPTGRSTEASGLTLLELIVVMALIGIVFFFAVPRFEGSFLLDDAKKDSRWLIAKVQALREEAQRTRRLQVLHIDFDGGRIWATSAAMGPEAIANAAAGAARLPGGGSVAAVEFRTRGRVAAGQVDIHFYRDGHSDQALIHLRHGDSIRSLLLEPFLSRVTVFDRLVGFDELR
ncbi:MAG: type II secretion system protein [Desulfobacterales bacterium]